MQRLFALDKRKGNPVTYRKTAAPWLYVAGGAALGLVALGAAARRNRRTLSRDAATSANDEGGATLAGDVSNVPKPVQEAIAASAHARGVNRPLSEDLIQEIFGHVAHAQAAPGNDELSDPKTVEVLFDGASDEQDLTARRSDEARLPDDAYDAVAPDDLASEWLTRAIESSPPPSGERLNPESAELLRDAGMSVVSQGSLDASSADQLEAVAIAELEGLDDEDISENDDDPTRIYVTPKKPARGKRR